MVSPTHSETFFSRLAPVIDILSVFGDRTLLSSDIVYDGMLTSNLFAQIDQLLPHLGL